MVLLLLFVLFIVWGNTQPRAYHALIADWQRRWRLFVISFEGERGFRELEQMMYKATIKRKIPRTVVNKFMSLYKTRLVDEIGRRRATLILGEPTPYERYF